MEAITVIGERPHCREAGFTYIALLIVVAIMGVWLAATANVLHLRVQRDKEQELLYIGHEFRQALEHYASSSVGAARRLPLRLEDLLLDERQLEKRRHLRRIYLDPMTGTAEWGVVTRADGQIMGVHSLSTAEPVKTAGFEARDQAFTGKHSYADWVFMAAVASGSPDSAVAPPKSAPGVRAPAK
jgi:type II secretory pathway pseudopilin PulG